MPYRPQGLKYFLSGALQKKFTDFCFKSDCKENSTQNEELETQNWPERLDYK